ncbi:Ubiquitin-specific protease 14 isoform 4 [Hibiscus syriacus]|uniref:Ubiquitin-specific protease 14 isoform 4 n=1 Tax=Hibiscus syriacus TaxID=106335 RepID=A0A6A2XE21_HIBSY|nr:Ubiquitin-specific protease 14 isoform 4 [Hibiscus syriacus]
MRPLNNALHRLVRLAVDAILMAEGAERKEQVAAWTADKKQISAYAIDLRQIGDVVVPQSGWKCAKCDKRDNLWLNLTDGIRVPRSRFRLFRIYRDCGRRGRKGLIDISHMRSKGLQPGEELFPEAESCHKHFKYWCGRGHELVASHMDDPDIDAPISHGAKVAETSIDQSAVDTLVSFGFEEEIARMALKASKFLIAGESSAMDTNTSSNSTPTPVEAGLPNGGGSESIVSYLVRVFHICLITGLLTRCNVSLNARISTFRDSESHRNLDTVWGITLLTS